MEENAEVLDNLNVALAELLALVSRQDRVAATAMTAAIKNHHKIRFEIELPDLSLVCSISSGDHARELFRVEGGPDSSFVLPLPKDN